MKKTGRKALFAALLSVALALIFCFTACASEEEPAPEQHRHTLQKVLAVRPTCTEAGNLEYWRCTSEDCTGATGRFADAEGITEITDSASVILPPAGHTLAEREARAATCTEAGHAAYWECDECGEMFGDGEASVPVTETDVTIAPVGHSFTITVTGGRREYRQYETLTVEGMQGRIACSSCDFEREIPITASMISGFDSTTPGSRTLTVVWRENASDPRTEASTTFVVTVIEDKVVYDVTLENAWYEDDAQSGALAYGDALPADVRTVPGKTLVGWYDRSGNRYYGGDEFRVSGDVTLTAVYAEDLETTFTPSCVFEDLADGSRRLNMTHETADGVNATNAVFDGVSAGEGYKILNNDGTFPGDGCDNGFPVYADRGNLAIMTFINRGTAALSFDYTVDHWGDRGTVSVTAPAGTAVTVPLPYEKAPDGKDGTEGAFHRILFTETVSEEVSLTIYGRIYTYTDYAAQRDAHLLTLYGAAFADGTSEGYFAYGTDALNGVVPDPEKTLIGWADRENTLYADGTFTMPAADTVLCAVYREDLGDAFTPSCVLERMSDGRQSTMEHTTVNGVKATTYAIEGGVAANTGYKILNNAGNRPDSCANDFPLSASHGNFVILTLINNGTSPLSVIYQVEYYGVLGEVAATVPAGESVEVPLSYGKAKADASSSFHQLYFTEATEDDISLTIYGRMYDPDYYEKEQPHTLTFRGAAYGGETSVSLAYGASLDAERIETEAGRTVIAWTTADGVYETAAELAEHFSMGVTDGTVTAVYADDPAAYADEMQLFTPSCVYKDKSLSDSGKLQGTHNADGSTSYAIDTGVASWMIYNGSDETNRNDGNVNNGCPVGTDVKRLYVYTLTNEGDADLTLKLGPEYFGMKCAITVTVPAGETVSAGAVLYGFDTSTVFWQIDNLSPAEGQTTLTVVCHYV